MRVFLVVFAAMFGLAGCGSPSPSPTVPTTARPAATPSPAPTVLAFPTVSEVQLTPGRYDSSPPFEFAFTFEIPDPGWNSAHLHWEFFDVMRFDGPDRRVPTRWLAWAHPQTIHGERDAAAVELTPREAAELMATQIGVDPGAIIDFSFAGLTGVQIDLHTDIGQVPLFGGPGGDFQLDNSQDARIGLVKLEQEMLLVMCLAPPDDLDTACAEVQPMLDSVEL